MSTIIQDGTGTGRVAKVDTDNRLSTRSVTETNSYRASINGDHFAIGTGLVNLTDAAEHATYFVKNTDTNDLFIDRFIVNALGAASSTDDFLVLSIYQNPTGMSGGTGNDLIQTNVNFGSSKTPTTTSEQGQQGASITGGTFSGAFVLKKELSTFIDIRIVLPKDASLGLTITAPTGNTNFNVITFTEATTIFKI